MGPAGALPLFRAHRLHTRKNDISSTVDLYVRPYHTASTQEQSSSASQHLPTNLHTLGTNSVMNTKNAYSLTRGSSVRHPRRLGEKICLLEVPSHPGPSHVATLADSQCSRQHLPYHRGAVLAPLLLQGVVSHTGTWPHQWSAEVELSPMATRTLGAKPACHRSGTQSPKTGPMASSTQCRGGVEPNGNTQSRSIACLPPHTNIVSSSTQCRSGG